VLTGETNEELGLDAVRHGVQDYLIKGQTYGRYTARAIRYAIERKQVEDALLRTEQALRESERQLRESNTDLERRVAERTASLEETISDLEDFSHSITHDLRAPLRAIRSFAQILGEECLACGRPKAQEHIHRITSAAARMDRLIQDVLQYSRLARSELRLSPVNVQELLRGIIESYPAFQPPQVEIQINGPLPRMLGNEAALTQCFSNLLGNALKFVAPGTRPQVRVWAERVGDPKAETRDPQPATLSIVRLSFADNGIGIPKDAHERIFKMFQRLDKSYDGTGVGLTVVRKAVEKMGGTVGLESEPGRGSRFWIELKAAGDSKPSNGQEGPNE
jgi:signal transduction histidine kinase